jgi:hypothetical protein
MMHHERLGVDMLWWPRRRENLQWLTTHSCILRSREIRDIHTTIWNDA